MHVPLGLSESSTGRCDDQNDEKGEARLQQNMIYSCGRLRRSTLSAYKLRCISFAGALLPLITDKSELISIKTSRNAR